MYQPGNISWIMAIGAFFVFLYLDIKDWYKGQPAKSDVKADEAIPVSKAKSSAKNRKGEQKADRSAEKSDTTRSVADVAEPSTQLVGFFKGAVVGYVAMTICLSLTLLVMLLLGQNVEPLVELVAGGDVHIDQTSSNPLLLAFSLQKEFTLIKLAVAGCAAGPLRRILEL